MEEITMSLTEQFIQAFVASYKDANAFFQGAEWEQVWKFHWSRFMLWNPPSPQVRPVLQMTADRMGLMYWDREPFRVDAAFVRPDFRLIGNLPVPLVIAIEHENDFRTFEQEIAKLAHIRCPLKVGITYSLLSVPPKEVEVEKLLKQIKNWLSEINDLIEIEESPRTEYLYLIGVENLRLTLEWYTYSYIAGNGYDKGLFVKVGG
jgi:hypothetical protein